MMDVKQPTAEENKLASELRARGVKLTQQKSFTYTNGQNKTGYIHSDICIESLNLVIEVDGNYHKNTADQLRRDKLRDKTVRSHGYDVQHVGNNLVNNPLELRAYADQIAGEYRECTTTPTKQPAVAPTTPQTTPTPPKAQSYNELPPKLPYESPSSYYRRVYRHRNFDERFHPWNINAPFHKRKKYVDKYTRAASVFSSKLGTNVANGLRYTSHKARKVAAWTKAKAPVVKHRVKWTVLTNPVSRKIRQYKQRKYRRH